MATELKKKMLSIIAPERKKRGKKKKVLFKRLPNNHCSKKK